MVYRAVSITRRDAVLLLLGAAFTRLWVSVTYPGHEDRPIYIDAGHSNTFTNTITVTVSPTKASTPVTTTLIVPPSPVPTRIDSVKSTSLIHHAPGWTLFEDIYMSDGTLFIVSDNPSQFPEIRMMISTGLIAMATPENMAAREPTANEMVIISREEAANIWGADGTFANRVLPVEGNTLLVNEPAQFLRHYYHFVAELFFGVQVFWHGAFYQSQNPAPPIHRMIFAHSNTEGWRDGPGMNTFFLQAAFPSIHVEVQEAWEDRIALTANGNRVWHFPRLLLSDRSAAHRGTICGAQTQRIAAEAWKYMQMLGVRGTDWWEPVRSATLRLAKTLPVYSGDTGPQAALGFHGAKTDAPKVVITYISRQRQPRRKLLDASHDSLVAALTQLVNSKNGLWELNIVTAETMTLEEQLLVVGRTDILLGVHGNGLTHLVMTPASPISTVIEILYPGGWAHDFQWTAVALQKSHFGIWNDTVQVKTANLYPNYPEGFQGTEIPVHGPTVAQLIEEHLAGKV
ncbi:hypothetical protein FB45DRAFT_293252 [Roridomyces roridus]|uniref:Glycosyltransferase 61 catalytic domain-containing protein n=1 Tax=Roridomyces roridus TaxID=1738132 RepID=A0AAD7FYJ9_9AGAR|nr:hypothetical protein FB45DRAFT_293252 [Roridomyces roridus]